MRTTTPGPMDRDRKMLRTDGRAYGPEEEDVVGAVKAACRSGRAWCGERGGEAVGPCWGPESGW